MTNDEKRELRDLYARLAKRWDYPMPKTWEDDLPAIKADADNALKCLRVLVADQCPESINVLSHNRPNPACTGNRSMMVPGSRR